MSGIKVATKGSLEICACMPTTSHFERQDRCEVAELRLRCEHLSMRAPPKEYFRIQPVTSGSKVPKVKQTYYTKVEDTEVPREFMVNATPLTDLGFP